MMFMLVVRELLRGYAPDHKIGIFGCIHIIH